MWPCVSRKYALGKIGMKSRRKNGSFNNDKSNKKDMERYGNKNQIRTLSYELLEICYEANATMSIEYKIRLLEKCIAKVKTFRKARHSWLVGLVVLQCKLEQCELGIVLCVCKWKC